MAAQQNLTIGQIAARTGLSVSAIRYYENQKLVKPGRNAGGQRRFFRSDIRRLSFVLIAQQFGFSLDQIREQFSKLPDARTPTKKDWTNISAKMRRALNQRIQTLTNLRDNLDNCIGCGCLSLQKCALYNPADQAAVKGTGPRFLLGESPHK